MAARLLLSVLSAGLTAALLGVPQPVAAGSADVASGRAAAPVAPTQFGVIASTQGSAPDTFEEHVRRYDEHRRRYGGPIGIRIFAGSSGQLPLPTDRSRTGRLLAWAASAHPDEPITVSHKVRDDARLRRLLDWVRATGVRLSVIYRHEAQPDWFDLGQRGAEPAVYRATYRAYRAVIAAHPARPRVTLEKNLMWFWQRYRTGAKPQSDWRHYVEAGDPADLLSWDTYAFPGMPTEQGDYGTPDDFFRYARAAWHQFRLPWAVGEIGTIVQDGTGVGRCTEKSWDPDGSRFAAWVRQMTAAAADPATIGPGYAGLPPARFVKWWGAPDTDDCDLSLEQSPDAVAAFRVRLQRSHF
jgi:hypothetical protein